tara:strand:+ start:1610 stop:1825 length:216 start_codon:yes stop_codon:yes gene_type:complete
LASDEKNVREKAGTVTESFCKETVAHSDRGNCAPLGFALGGFASPRGAIHGAAPRAQVRVARFPNPTAPAV